MLGFSPFASTAFDSLPGIIISRTKIPVEILSTIRTVIEQLDIPIEISVIKTEPEVLKWVLSSRDGQWVLDSQSSKWVLTSREKRWVLNDINNKWVLDSRLSKWVVK